MIFSFDERLSDSPFVERIWRARSERTGGFLSVAASHWEIVISKYYGEITVTVRGPETRVTPLDVTLVGAEFFGIDFKLGTIMPHLPASALIDGDVELPDASRKSFWLNGSAWELPNYENADTFVNRLVSEDMLVRDPVVESVQRGVPQELSPRTIQRHFMQATGLTQSTVRQIERARYAAMLLQQGVSILDTVDLAGYADQAHLTRSLRHFTGKTPAGIIHKTEFEQMSLLFKTEPFH
jgi:AraC-like DNA-binding protein